MTYTKAVTEKGLTERLFPEVLVGLDSAIRDRVIICSWQQQAALTDASPEGAESEVQFLDSGRGAGSRGPPGRSRDSGWRGHSQPAVTSREVARKINTPSSLLPPLSCQCPGQGILFFSPYRSSFRGRGQDGEESRATLGVQMEDTQRRRFAMGLDNWHGAEPGTQKILKTWGLLWFLSVFPALVGLVFNVSSSAPLASPQSKTFSNPFSSMRSEVTHWKANWVFCLQSLASIFFF